MSYKLFFWILILRGVENFKYWIYKVFTQLFCLVYFRSSCKTARKWDKKYKKLINFDLHLKNYTCWWKRTTVQPKYKNTSPVRGWWYPTSNPHVFSLLGTTVFCSCQWNWWNMTHLKDFWLNSQNSGTFS